MDVFMNLFRKLIPLYILILIWYLSAKYLNAQKKTIASLLIYVITPVIVFYWTYIATLDAANLTLPLMFFILCSLMALIFLFIWNKVYGDDSTKNILAFASGTWNTGYFWLPVILMLYGEQAFSIAVLSALWFTLFENTVGFFMTAKWSHSLQESFWKVIKLPTIYAFIIWLMLNYFQIGLSDLIVNTIQQFKWAYTLLWMMIIGMWLYWVSLKTIDYKFIGITFLAKFAIRPILILWLVYLDSNYVHFFDSWMYEVMLLLWVVPLAANTVAVATELDVQPAKASIAVLLSTLFALFFIPLVMSFLS